MVENYSEWLDFVFNREVKHTPWYFDIDEPQYSGTSDAFVDLITKTTLNSGTDLAQYSDAQVKQGLNYIFNNTCSDVVFALMAEGVPWEKRAKAIRSISVLYRDCFTQRCTPVLGHLSETGSPLNDICYMFWDVSPLSYWESRPNRAVAYDEVCNVLNEALMFPNIACVESALHGLGHLHCYVPERVEEILNRFLKSPSIKDQRLIQYAERAYTGNVL